MPLNFHDIRAWNGSQQSGFEELCCQLAAREDVPGRKKFYRLGVPDAGVECYWQRADGTEWGWQAKYMFAVENTQWQQIDDSVRVALEKHPRLVRYTICLPIDRPDARIPRQTSMMVRWNERVITWQRWARERHMEVEFDYWGQHEIAARLALEQHAGRRYFWFSREEFSQDWFERHLRESVAQVGPRYTPELHVDLPIAQVFDGLGLTERFLDQVRKPYGEVRLTWARLTTSRRAEKWTTQVDDAFPALAKSLRQLMRIVAEVGQDPFGQIPAKDIIELSHSILGAAQKCRARLEKADEDAKQHRSSLDQPDSVGAYHKPEDSYSVERSDLNQLGQGVSALVNFAEGDACKLANRPALLLTGGAGTGKTHLFCDVASSRIRSDHLPTIVLLGQHFNRAEPWTQIVQQLHLNCTRDELLGALEAAAEALGRRALILIDALNEGEGKRLWKDYLPGIVEVLRRYPSIGLAVSCRSSYVDLVIRDDLLRGDLVRVDHPGFAGHEFDAVRTFFDHYGIVRPSVPFLIPEFENPLFLKILCEGLKNTGQTRMPTGFRGVTSIFDFFLDSVNHKLAGPDFLDFREGTRVVHRAVDGVAELMASRGKPWIPEEEAQKAVDSVLQPQGYTNSLYYHLISEGVLAEDRFYDLTLDKYAEGIRFPYERFSDHVICGHLLDRDLDPKQPETSLKPGSTLGDLVKDQSAAWMNSGLIAALCVQLPERASKELFDVVPCEDFPSVQDGFIQSLIWRAPSAISDQTVKHINRLAGTSRSLEHAVLDALLTLAAIPDHPLNADFLHRNLLRMTMSDRDRCWSIFLHDWYGQQGAADRLLDWGWPQDPERALEYNRFEDEPLRLACVALAWFLTTSHRFVRDKATKALVTLLQRRLHLLRQVLKAFRSVNDCYVLERLYAVAYGCVMLSEDRDSVRAMAEDTYRHVFAEGKPIPHLLLRDYARGIIEYSIHLQCAPELDLSRVRPPYQSEWPLTAPNLSDLRTSYRLDDRDVPLEQSYTSIWSSLGGFGDFARYIIGTDSAAGLANWTASPLKATRARGPFDTSLAQRWIFQRVVDLGWTPEKFGGFDRWVNYNDRREANKPERVGKKYQWIAFHEFTAHVADHCKFGQPWTSARRYDGPWQIGRRDIDTSWLGRTSGPEHRLNQAAWWAPVAYDVPEGGLQDAATWLATVADCPDPIRFIQTVNPRDQSSWLTLEGYYGWEELLPPEQEDPGAARRQLWYQVRSYLIRKNHEPKMVKWLNQQHFMGRWMPESFDFLDVFVGEYPWASSFNEYRGDWVKEHTRDLPWPVIVTGTRYLWESSRHDCSIDSTVSGLLPAPYLVEGMEMAWARRFFRFEDRRGGLIAFDPSAEEAGPSALLISKPDLQTFLEERNLRIIWVLLGAKNVFGESAVRDGNWPGQLEIDGVYRLNRNAVAGAPLRARFVMPAHHESISAREEIDPDAQT